MCEGVRVVGRGSVRLATAQEACTLTGRAEWEEQWRTALQQSRSRVSFWRGGGRHNYTSQNGQAFSFRDISSLEGAMKLKFAPFCSSRDALSNEIIICQSQIFHFQAKIHGL